MMMTTTTMIIITDDDDIIMSKVMMKFSLCDILRMLMLGGERKDERTRTFFVKKLVIDIESLTLTLTFVIETYF